MLLSIRGPHGLVSLGLQPSDTLTHTGSSKF